MPARTGPILSTARVQNQNEKKEQPTPAYRMPVTRAGEISGRGNRQASATVKGRE